MQHTTLKHDLLQEIHTYLDELTKQDYYDEQRDFSAFSSSPFLNGHDSVTKCTTSAMMIAHKFHGQVFGYEIPDTEDNKNKVAYDCGGHDFAIVDHYLVDWWSKDIDGNPNAVLDFNNPEDMKIINEKYLPRDQWENLELWELKQ